MAWNVSRRQMLKVEGRTTVLPGLGSEESRQQFVLDLPQQVKFEDITSKFVPVSSEKDSMFTAETSGLVTLDQFRKKKEELAKLDDSIAKKNDNESTLSKKR
jgi:hypothetical protein